jgi:hypothetical protein
MRSLFRSALGFALVVVGIGCGAPPDDPAGSSQEAETTEPAIAYCDAIQRVVVSNASLVDADGDGVWDPGESVVLTFSATNTGGDAEARALGAYPGVRLTVDSPIVDIVTGTGPDSDVVTMTGTLPPTATRAAHFRLAAHSDVVAGTNVTISIAMTDNRWPFTRCDGPPLRVRATIGQQSLAK